MDFHYYTICLVLSRQVFAPQMLERVDLTVPQLQEFECGYRPPENDGMDDVLLPTMQLHFQHVP